MVPHAGIVWHVRHGQSLARIYNLIDNVAAVHIYIILVILFIRKVSLICCQIFQLLTNSKVNKLASQSSLGNSNSQSVAIEKIDSEDGTGEPTAFPGAKLIASLFDHLKDPTASSPAVSGENCDKSEGYISDHDQNAEKGKDETENNGNTEVPPTNISQPNVTASGSSRDGKVRKVSGRANKRSALLMKIRASAATEVDSSLALPTSASEAYKEGLRRGIISANDIEVSLENFPYYLR